MKIIKSNRTFRILFTGGGSGGHVYPLVSVLKEMQKFIPDFEKQGIDMEYYYIGSNDFTLDLIRTEKINIYPLNIRKISKNIFKNFSNSFVNFGSLIKAYFKILFMMPDAIFAKGGFASSLVLVIGVIFRIPIFIHESDSIPGFTNQVFAKFAKIVFISFEDSRKFIKNKNIELTGNPIDDNLLIIADGQDSIDIFKERIGLNNRYKTLLVLGGSQGAQTINNLIIDMLPGALQKYEIIHQVGIDNFEAVKKEVAIIFKEVIKDSECERRYHPIPILNHKTVLAFESLGYSMLCSDLIISRAGSGSIFEVAAFKKPSIMIPLPWASRDHQSINAYNFSKDKACVVLEQSNLKPNLLLDTVDGILDNPAKIEMMKAGCDKFAKKDAGLNIAKIILKELVKKYKN